MTGDAVRHWRILAALVLSYALGSTAHAGASDLVGAAYRADTPFPQFIQLWHEGWRLTGPDGERIQYAHEGMPLGGYVHVYFRNPEDQPLEITDVLLEGVSLVEAITFSEHTAAGLHPASIGFSELPRARLDRLMSAGEPVWWKVSPRPIPPHGMAELVIRLRRNPRTEYLNVKVLGGDLELETRISVHEAHARMSGVYFSPDLGTAYLYLRHPNGGGHVPTKIFLDGKDVTSHSAIGADVSIDIVPAVIRLREPLEMGSFHCFKAVYRNGSTALAGVRAWGSDLIWGMWGSTRVGDTPAERARNYLLDMREHNINVHMGMYGARGKSFMESREGWDFIGSIGMRQMATWYGNAGNPILYFLRDEPDAQDFGVDWLEPFQRLGTLGQPLVERSHELRKKDPTTVQLLNIDNTYKPENWYMYAQLPDVMCADPYYQEQLRQVYLSWPSGLALHTKPTYVYAAGTICQSACAPKPLHLILQSVRHDMADMPFRFPTPEEKRVEVYYALGAGAKGLSFWWYTPSGDCYGCGAEDPEAVKIWNEIGLLGAEARTAGPVITTSCPTPLAVTASPRLWVRSLLTGLDTVAMIVVNDNFASDRVGTVFQPVGNANMSVRLPSWIRPSDVFEVTYNGTKEVTWQAEGSNVSVDLGEVELTRLILVTSDAGLRDRLQALYEAELADNVAKLIAERGVENKTSDMRIERSPNNPIIYPGIDDRIGSNINGPSLIRVPDWIEKPLGRYYLYFAHHKGDYIRLAYADKLEGPWTTYEPGTLALEDSFCRAHIASPDVHMDDERREIRMYYHGPTTGGQKSRVAVSKDGIHFAARPEILGEPYFRVFGWGGYYYALGMPGVFYRSKDGLTDFEQGPTLYTEDMRHTALKLDGDTLSVFFSNVGDRPERILLSTIELTPDWMTWQATEPVAVLQPLMDYEGVDLPLERSVRGWAPEPVRQLRDPAIFREDGKTYLLYSVAGEHGIAIAEIEE